MSPGTCWANSLEWASELSRGGLLKHRWLGSQHASRVSDMRDLKTFICNKFPDAADVGN